MKKSIILSFAFCFFFSLLSGQSKWNIGPSVIFGLSGEQQFHEIDYETYGNARTYSFEESKVLPSMGAGIQVERLIGKRWGINIATQYSYIQRFERSEYSYFSSPLSSLSSFNLTETKFISHQIQAPVQLHFYFGKPGKVRPYISLGGQLSYAISVKQETETLYASNGEASVNEWSNKYDLKSEWSDIPRFSTSMSYGLGVAFKGFAVEVNRVQNVLTTTNYNGSYRLNYYSPYGLYQPSKSKIHTTIMSVKYWL